jgi:anti-sigma factor RsiW
MKNFREIEHLSAYLDGQLNTSELARLESRLNSDPELVSVLDDLRATRGILVNFPNAKRRATSPSPAKWWDSNHPCQEPIPSSDLPQSLQA